MAYLKPPVAVVAGGTGQSSYTNGQLLIGNTTGNTLTKAPLTGTSNQVIVTNGTGSITLTTPQDIGLTSNVNFGSLTITTSSAIPISSYCNVASSTPFASTNQFNFSSYNQDATNNNWQFIVFNDHNGVVSNAIGTQITNQSNGTSDLFFYTKPSGGSVTQQMKIASTGIVSLTQPLPAASGGSGFASYAIGDILYADTTTSLAKLADIATGNALISGGVTTAPSWGKIGLTTHINGTLGVANGGTGTATTFTQGSVVYAGASGIYAQDNSNFFWDATNHRLGLGIASPSDRLHVKGGGNVELLVEGNGTGNSAAINILTAATSNWRLGRGIGTGTGEFSIFDSAAGTNAMVITTGGNITMGTNSSSQLTINGVTTTTANSGGTLPPVNVQGFIDVIINGTHRKIPYYLN